VFQCSIIHSLRFAHKRKKKIIIVFSIVIHHALCLIYAIWLVLPNSTILKVSIQDCIKQVKVARQQQSFWMEVYFLTFLFLATLIS